MTSIPVVVLGIKRANNKAVSTANHLRKVGFKNVSIYYGIDLKKDTKKIKEISKDENVNLNTTNIAHYNSNQILKRELQKGTNEIIITEDDVRITDKEGLFKHLKNGIKGVDRLVWNRLINSGSAKGAIQGNQMTGYSRRGMKSALEISKLGLIDLVYSRNLSPKEKVSGSFGIEYIYPDMTERTERGEIKGSMESHNKPDILNKRSRALDAGEDIKLPRAHNRYK
jgi:hypothetical protein